MRLALRARSLGLYGADRVTAGRDPAERRKYAADPWAYAADIVGVMLTADQEQALDLIESEDRVLLPSGNNVGKTFLLALYGLYRMDAVAALPDESLGLGEQGGRILLPGPDSSTIFGTIYSEMIALAERSIRRGYPMPGEPSQRSVHWLVRPQWQVEPFSPPDRVSQEVAHSASGRHHRNQVALLEEGQGVDERVWRGTEGMCSSEGNKIVSSFNPTESMGPAFDRANNGSYAVLHLSAFDHPNVKERRAVIPAAIGSATIDKRVRADCRDRGPHPDTEPDEQRHEFVYALPPKDAEEDKPRGDGVMGHADGEPRVYSPSPTFVAQVLGQWPKTATSGWFDPGKIDAAMERWEMPKGLPDIVGVDPAREGADESCAAPLYGEGAEVVLRAFQEARLSENGAVPHVQKTRRLRIGELRTFGKGKGPEIAQRVAATFPDSPYNVDETGIGSSVFDHLTMVMGRDAEPVVFGARAPDPLPGLPWCENVRSYMYRMLAELLDRDLVDLPPDRLLRQELLAHNENVKVRARVVDVVKDGEEKKQRVAAYLLEEKEEIKKRLGRSPDRSDAVCLAVLGPRAPAIEFDSWEEGFQF